MRRGEATADQIVGFKNDKARPVFHVLSETRYVLSVEEHGVELEIDRLQRERGDLVGELIVRVNWAGAPTYNGILSRGRFNLDSSQTRGRLAKELRAKAKLRAGDPVDFDPLLEEFCIRVAEADRAGMPAVDLTCVPMPVTEPTITVAGFTLLANHPQIIFGDGGSAKSLLGLYLAGELVLQHGFTVLFVDWELDQYEHRRRLWQLFQNEIPAGRLHYVRCDKPLVHELDRLKRIKHETSATFAVADSVAFASDGKPEDADVSLRYVRSLRQLGVGSLNLAHITKGTDSENDQKPFGSAFWHNNARMTWFVKAADETPTGLSIGLFNRKANLGPKLAPLGYEIDFRDDRITFMRTQVEDIESLASGLPLWQRMRQAVRHKPQTLAALANELGAKPDTLDRTVRRMTRVFTRVRGQDGVPLIALVARDAA